MSAIRHELALDKRGDGTVLHCYLPPDLSTAVPSYDTASRQIVWTEADGTREVGAVPLPAEFTMPDPIQAKFNRKQARFTFNLLKVPGGGSVASDEDSGTAADQGRTDGAPPHAAAAAKRLPDMRCHSNPPTVQSSCEPLALDELCQHSTRQHEASAKQQQSQDSDDGADEDSSSNQQPAAGSIKQPPAAAAAQHPEEEEEDEEDEAKQGGKKRRGQRKKKKKKGGKADTSAAAAAAADGGDEEDAAAPAAAGIQGSSSSATAAAPAGKAAAAGAPEAEADGEDDVFVDALSDGDEEPAAASGSSNPERPQHPASKQAGRSGGGAAPPVRVPDAPRTAPPGPLSARVAEVQFTTDNYHEFFADEPVAGTTQLPGGGVEPVLPGSLVQGPTVASCLDRHEVKGEDKALNMRGGTWTPAGSSACASFSAFGIFDGHGGKSSATMASKELLPTITRLLDRCKATGCSSSMSQRAPSQALSAASASASGGADFSPPDGQAWGVEVTEEDRAVWAAQEAMADRLPMAMFAGFLEADKVACRRFKTSGTTATLAVVVGWELFVANVGDSAAYLDTGKQVITLTANHRVDDNMAERERVEAAGGRIGKASCPESGKPVGPDRAWPGGLAMSRTIGDVNAPQVIAVPEVRHVTLPTTGGRIIIASDGVWDHTQPKAIIHQVRNLNTAAAAKRIGAQSLRKKGMRDDISVIVVDLVPADGDLRPPALLLGSAREEVEACQVIRPLQEACGADGSVSPGGAQPGRGGARRRGGDSSSSDDDDAGEAAAGVTAMSAHADGHWRETAAARRAAAVRLLRSQARAAAEAAAADAARAAAAAAVVEAEEEAESETYKQLKSLKLDPAELAEQLRREREAAKAQAAAAEAAAAAGAGADDGWTAVGSAGGDAAEDEEEYVSLEEQMRAHAHRVPLPAAPEAAAPHAAGGRGRGRGSRGDRGRGGRGDRRPRAAPGDSWADGEQQPAGPAAGGAEHDSGNAAGAFAPCGRGGRRGRGGRGSSDGFGRGRGGDSRQPSFGGGDEAAAGGPPDAYGAPEGGFQGPPGGGRGRGGRFGGRGRGRQHDQHAAAPFDGQRYQQHPYHYQQQQGQEQHGSDKHGSRGRGRGPRGGGRGGGPRMQQHVSNPDSFGDDGFGAGFAPAPAGTRVADADGWGAPQAPAEQQQHDALAPGGRGRGRSARGRGAAQPAAPDGGGSAAADGSEAAAAAGGGERGRGRGRGRAPRGGRDRGAAAAAAAPSAGSAAANAAADAALHQPMVHATPLPAAAAAAGGAAAAAAPAAAKPAKRIVAVPAVGVCFVCGEPGHFARDCTNDSGPGPTRVGDDGVGGGGRGRGSGGRGRGRGGGGRAGRGGRGREGASQAAASSVSQAAVCPPPTDAF